MKWVNEVGKPENLRGEVEGTEIRLKPFKTALPSIYSQTYTKLLM
jgi:hypothetical protein